MQKKSSPASTEPLVVNSRNEQLRANALGKIRQVSTVSEPSLIPLLEPRPGVSTLKMIKSAVDSAVSPDTKAELVGIEVELHIDEGNPVDAVRALARVNAGSLPLERYGQDYLIGLFKSSMSSDLSQAWAIAKTMLSDGESILNPTQVNPQNYGIWMGFEQQAFDAYAREVLSKKNQMIKLKCMLMQ